MNINYVYFDSDNSRIVETLEDLKAIYYLGVRRVYEYSYLDPTSGVAMYAMSSTGHTDAYGMWIKLHLTKWRIEVGGV